MSTTPQKHPHTPVLLQEILTFFQDKKISTFVDCTIGMGGHAESLLKNHEEITRYIAIDRDPQAVEYAKNRLAPWKEKLLFIHGNFADLDSLLIAHEQPLESIDGILADFGVSSLQFDDRQRGFSFIAAEKLDMRMDPTQIIDAIYLLETLSQKELEKIFLEYGEEPRYRQTAQLIVEYRQKKKITSLDDLQDALEPMLSGRGKKHPLTLIFQALRIAVNQELQAIDLWCQSLEKWLNFGGQAGAITFHSLEDRIVKTHFQALSRRKESPLLLYNKHVIAPTFEEIKKNKRARSAKFRGIIRPTLST